MDEKIVKLQELIDQHDNICVFWRSRCIDGEWDPGFPFPGRTVSSEI